MKTLLLSLSALFIFLNSYAQPAVNAKKQAEIAAAAMTEKDYETLFTYTHPKIVKMLGGKPKMIETIKKSLKEMEDGGASFESVKIGEVSKMYKVGAELQCTIDQTVMMNVRGGTVSKTTCLLGFSSDQGKKWTFVDVNSKTKAQMKTFFPNLSPQLVFPTPSEGVFKPL